MHILYDAMIHEKLYEFYIQYFNQYVTIEIVHVSGFVSHAIDKNAYPICNIHKHYFVRCNVNICVFMYQIVDIM